MNTLSVKQIRGACPMTTPMFTLKLQHFMTSAAHAHRNLLAPWAERIARDSGGRLGVELFTGMELGGKAEELFDQSRTGFIDLAWMLPSYNPGRFLKSEVFELPFVASPSARVTSSAFQDFVETYAADEFSEVKPIFFWTHDFGVLCLNRHLEDIDDLKDRRIRILTRAQKEIFQALGAIPHRLNIYAAVEAFAKGELDGLILPWEGVRSFGAIQHATHYLEFDFDPTLYTQTHMMTMNRARYEGLPADLRRAIDANAGLDTARSAGGAWDSEAALVRRVAHENGARFIELPASQIEEIKRRTHAAAAYWFDEMRRAGLDPQFYHDRARELVSKHAAA